MKLPSYPWRFVHLAALWGYGVSQPVFAMLDTNPEFLVINGASRGEAVAFALLLAFGPPLLAVLLQLACGLVSASLSSIVHLLSLWLFGCAAALQLLELFDPSSRATILVPVVVAYVGAMAYMRWSPLRMFLTVSSVLPVLGLLMFVTTAPLALANTKASTVKVASKTPVVLIVFDEFPASSLMKANGGIDTHRYPGFGRLAREGTWYPRATTVDTTTTKAVPAILTGLRPTPDGLPTLADYPNSLFTFLGKSYAFRVRESVTRLCPVRYCPSQHTPRASRLGGLLHDVGINYLHGSLPNDLRGNIAPLREGWEALVKNSAHGEQPFLGSIRRSNPRNTLYFVHSRQPHVPWSALPSGHQYGEAPVIAGVRDDWEPGDNGRWRDNEPWLVVQGLQRHLLQVGNVDRFVQDLLERLDASGLYDDALVIVTADHGVSFRSGGWRRHATPTNLSAIAAVPLFVKFPGQKQGAVDRRAASVVDVVPTIADVLGVDLPWSVDGRSLRDEPARSDVRLGSGDAALVASADEVARGVLREARRNEALFGEGDGSMYRAVPRPELVGRAVATLSRAPAQPASLDLLARSELANVDKASGFVPVHLLGQIDWGDMRPDEDLAVAINGRVATVTQPFESTGDTWFSAFVDEDVLRDGHNTFELFAVRGHGRMTRVIPLGGVS